MSLGKMWRDTLALAWLKSIPDLKRQPLILVLLIGITALPLFFITLFAEDMLEAGLIGVIVSTVSFIGITASIQDITWDRYVKLKEMVVAMPVHPLSYAMGLTMAALIFSLPGAIFFLGVGVYRGMFDVWAILTTIGSIALCWLGLSVIGFTIATYQQKASPNTLGIIANLLSFGLVFLPPVYYSEEMLGDIWWVSLLVPTSNAAAIIRYSTGITDWNGSAYMLHWLALLLTVLIFTVLVIKKARWREP